MAVDTRKNIIMKSDVSRKTKVFAIISGAAAFAAFFLTFLTSLSVNGAYFAASVTGIAVTALLLVFKRKKAAVLSILAGVVVYTALCVGVGFRSFVGGFQTFWNCIANNANDNLHWGFPGFIVEQSFIGDFLFASVLSAWMGFGSAFLCKRRSLYAAVSIAFVVILICLGCFPKAYMAAILALALLGLMLSNRRLSSVAVVCFMLCALLFMCVLIPCFLYGGNSVVKNFRKSVYSTFDKVTYGSDSLPEGVLAKSSGMRSSDDVKLLVSATADTPILYLKGFIGGQFSDNEWSVTDKNAYVQNGYQGLMEYLSKNGISTVTQFATYAAAGGNHNAYDVSVTNVSANRKYIYAPYSAASYTEGSEYYDLGLRGGLFTSNTYDYILFNTDRSSERVIQASWIGTNSNNTDEQMAYKYAQAAYQSFVYDVYSDVDDDYKTVIDNAFPFRNDSINTTTQQIRAYFTANFSYSDAPDGIESDFISEFFGGKIEKANSVYFATAATNIFRYCGFASRYVEGYLVRNADGADVKDLKITGNNAHAWTEVYFDGIGWLPIEVTPTYYSEEEKEETIDPTDPSSVDDPIVEPIIPTEKQDDPPEKDDPVVKPTRPITPEEKKMVTALKAIIPVLCVFLAAGIIILASLLRRNVALKRKNERLQKRNADFGRAAYSIVEKDCKRFGGFSAENLEKYGVAQKTTARFVELVEKSVYSGKELTDNERLYVTRYIRQVAESLTDSCADSRKILCKYVYCLGL